MVVVVPPPDRLKRLPEVDALLLLSGGVDVGDDHDGDDRLRDCDAVCRLLRCFGTKQLDVCTTFFAKVKMEGDGVDQLVEDLGRSWSIRTFQCCFE